MEVIMNQITRYHDLSLICMVGMIICACVTGIVYRKMNIREVIDFFRRNKKQKRILLLSLVCGWLLAGVVMPVEASQIEDDEVQEKEEEEIQEDLAPVLTVFAVYPGNSESEKGFLVEDESFCFVKNIEDADDIQIVVKICDEEESFDGEKVLLEYREAGTEQWISLNVESQEWTFAMQNQFETVYWFDGTENETKIYEFQISYTDAAGNAMTLGEDVLAEGENGTFVLSQKFVFDKVSPAFEAMFFSETGEELKLNEEGSSLDPYYNAAKKVGLNFKVTEENLDTEKTTIKVEALDRNGSALENVEEVSEYSKNWASLAESESAEQEITFVFTSDAHYHIRMHLVDKAGNETVYEKTFALDHSAPEKARITYYLENGDLLHRIVNQLTFGYFAKERVTAHIEVSDLVSGVDKIFYTCEDVDNEEPAMQEIKAVEKENDKNISEISVELPFSFKGNLKVYGMDMLGNTSAEMKDIGVIAEEEEKHQETSKVSLKVTGGQSKEVNYYQGDVSVKFVVQDNYSGVNAVSYRAGSELEETVYNIEETEIWTEEIVKEYTIPAASNNVNNVPLGIEFTDNAGHTTKLSEEQLPKIHIDTAEPKIQVIYDNYEAQNEKYYREERTATIYVTERNFDPGDVHFDISGPTTEISAWNHEAGSGCSAGNEPKDTGHSDSCVWKCKVKFSEDGEYYFGFSCVDLAGNEGSYGQIDEFVIDKTSPVLNVVYDNYDVKNEVYYNAPRTARITMKEKNFNPDDVQILVSAENGDQMLTNPMISGWTSVGDTHYASIVYDYDGTFNFDVVYEDLAGNEAADYPGDYFIVDLTRPEIVISEVEDKSANNGNVSPLITVTDTNYGNGFTWFEMNGWYNGNIDTGKAVVQIQNGEMIRIQDIGHTQEMDDLYCLKVGTSDLAGNESETEIIFSVNRFGSVYTFNEETENLVGENGSYYTDMERAFSVTETNVDTLVFREIICSLNGKLRTLQEGIDYTVLESGDETSWKQYRYEIKESNFTEEGHYTLTIYSEDRANNVSDNLSKGKSIAFAIDKSAPGILISGVEDTGQYRENSREITIDVQDNIGMSQVRVFLDDQEYHFDMSEIQDSDGILTLIAESKNTWQTVRVFGMDMAGNETYSEEITFLVTPNIFVQFYRNMPVFYGSLGGLMLLTAGIVVLICKRKRNLDASS